MKNTLLFLLFILLINICNAQKQKVSYAIAGAIGLPVGQFNKEFVSGTEVAGSAYFGMSNKSKLLFRFGYSFWPKKNTQSLDSNGIIIPFLAGYRYSIIDRFYLEGSAGLAIFTGVFESKATLNLNAGTGYLIPLVKNIDLDVFCKYSYAKYLTNSYSWVGVGLGINLSNLFQGSK